VNDWCKCQGDPGGKWWETLTISGLRDDGESADFNWTWGHDFFYHVRAKDHNKWEVSYLEGVEKKGYTIR